MKEETLNETFPPISSPCLKQNYFFCWKEHFGHFLSHFFWTFCFGKREPLSDTSNSSIVHFCQMNHSFNKIGFPPCYTYWESKSPSFNFPVRKQNTKCYVKASFTLIKGAREQEANVNVSCWPSPWGNKDRNKIR